MTSYYDNQYKKDYVTNFSELIETQQENYGCYFTTFTFSDIKRNYSYDLYHEYFKYFRQRLDNNLLQRPQEHSKKSAFILFPEASPQVHFHGVLFVNKLTSKRFTRKCVKNVVSEYNEKLKRDISSIRFNDNIINPYPKHIKERELQTKVINETNYNDRSNHQKSLTFQNQPLLKIQDYRIHPISSKEERERISQYSTKNFVFSEFKTEDIIIETKDTTDRKQQKALFEKRARLAKDQL